MARDLGFKAIDREEDYYFVSYSSADQERITSITKAMHKLDIPMWYDNGLEHGENWRRQLAARIGASDGVIFFISEDLMEKDKSYVQKEYAIATEMKKKKIYIVMLDKIDGTKVSDYLCDFWADIRDIHSIKIYQYLTEQGNVDPDRVAKAIKDMLEEKHSYFLKYNLDEEINSKFNDLFSGTYDSKEESVLQKKINAIKISNYLNFIQEDLVESRKKDDVQDWQLQVNRIIYSKYYLEEQHSQQREILGKNFSLPQKSNVKMLIFEVCTKVDPQNHIRYYSCEMLENDSYIKNGKNFTRYYVHNSSNGNDVVILMHNEETEDIFVNMGFFSEDCLKITKRPVVAHYVEAANSKILNFFGQEHSTSSTHKVSDNSIYSFNEVKSDNIIELDANLEGVINVVIDIDTFEPVLREIYFDKREEIYKAKIKLIKNKPYFVFQIKPDEDDFEGMNMKTDMKLSNLEIADFYCTGKCGFRKDVEKAILFYEKDGSAKAFYNIARIFKSDEVFKSDSLYKEYFQKAVDLGSVNAIFEVLLEKMKFIKEEKNDIYLNENEIDVLSKEESGFGLFVLGFCMENNIVRNNSLKDSFSYYYESASKDFVPAQIRINMSAKVDCRLERSNYEKWYNDNFQIRRSISYFCMGGMLFFGWTGYIFRSEGLEFLKESLKLGNVFACDILSEIYEIDSEYADATLATDYMIMRTEYTEEYDIELANRLIEGLGCEISDENDRIAFELLNRASVKGTKTALNNLAWMYERGRGCNVNKEKAVELYLKADSGMAYYHLGLIYENDDTEKALEYFKRAADLGNEKARVKLEVV